MGIGYVNYIQLSESCLLRIRLARRGTKRRPSYRIVVIPSRSSRDGRYVDDLGYYNPLPDPPEFKVNLEKASSWIANGAQPSDRVWKVLELASPGFKNNLKAPSSPSVQESV